jgi:bifunctional UDP-N-acetylglucosamine pyrophosphorylase / glucosamine-1-phosphate N-acetyltransferase
MKTHSTLAVVLAAGRGTRMKSSLPKVLHRVAGRPLVAYPVRAALMAGATAVVVVVSPDTRALVESALALDLPGASLHFAVQEEARGTGDALRAALKLNLVQSFGRLLILSGDTPLVEARHLEPLLLESDLDLAFLSFEASEPRGYGRVLRNRHGQPERIVEERDIQDDAVRRIREVNAGVYCGKLAVIDQAVQGLSPSNDQQEYYLTDIVEAVSRTGRVEAYLTEAEGVLGVNHRAELTQAEVVMHARICRRWGEKGVTITGRPLIDDTVELSEDVMIEDGVRLRGKTRIGQGARVDVGCVVNDSELAASAHLKPYCVVDQSTVGPGASIGPFAHLRPESTIEAEAHIGNFVETKKTIVRRGAKANHLAYLGDGDVGEGANIGAGVIFCNYDGVSKKRTTIGAGAFIGSDSQLVAPVNVGKDAYVATGTTVTENVPDDGFVIGRSRAIVKDGYASVLRARQRQDKG